MSMTTVHQNQSNRLRAYGAWLRELGVSRSTAWRWRQRKLFKTHSIGGKMFVDQSEIDQLYAQAKAGLLAKPRRMPRRTARPRKGTAPVGKAKEGRGFSAGPP
jgi:predicted DNA-binding transcriptional regulator AlpA